VLTTARATHDLPIREAVRHYPVRLHAVVTYYDPYINPQVPDLFVADSTGSIYVGLSSPPATPLKAGDSVEITGVSSVGDFAPIIAQGKVRVTGKSHLPLTAARAGLTDFLAGKDDGQWVEIEGVVHAVTESRNNVFLDLALIDGRLSAFTVKRPGFDYQTLVDARIVLRGNEGPQYNHQGQITGARIQFPDSSTLRVEQPAPALPFSLPQNRIGNLMRYNPDSQYVHRVHLHGAVTLLWPGRLICLQDGPRGLCAQTDQTTPMNLGDQVDVIGFPMVGAFTPTLDNASYRASAGSQGVSPVSAVSAVAAVTPMQALAGDKEAQPVQIAGRLIGEDRAVADPTFVFSSGNFIFSAVLSSPLLARALPTMEPGTEVKLTGICSVQSDPIGTNMSAGPSVAKSFRILLRSPDDVEIVQRPSWWNAAHTLRVLAIALVVTVLALLSAVILSIRVRRQTAVIRNQLAETAALKDAADFQATHDGLTGVRNRRAIFDQLRRELELAARHGRGIGVIMLDLDHFKHVNDTYGHIAGDDVLKQAVHRILEAVRSTDLVGRYGGEEFLILLPECNLDYIRQCAERIRRALAGKPILADGKRLSVTTSVGATVAMPPRHNEQDALKAADSALYLAKNSGRNCVVVADMDSSPFHGEDTPILQTAP
jgi:diguanylate cyclase (GGDEF)-like protein